LPADEFVDVVDELDSVIGVARLRTCLEKGLLHRAIAVLVLRESGAVLLQQRSKRDAWHPGRWTLSCTGHVKKGESYQAAAKRELREELGLQANIKMFSKIRIPTLRSRGLTEREWVTLFTSTSRAAVAVDPLELERVEEVSVGRLRRMMRGRRLTSDAKILLNLFLNGSSSSGSRHNHRTSL